VRYFYMHQKSHRDVEWGKKHIPWHYDHHMGKNQDANWGVTTAIWDLIMGTREKHYDEAEVRS
jgi:sterol desaturase/sphingolipid hydroxylase (fatty acid hydroxylase superfamily)